MRTSATLTLLVGAILVLASLLRLGFVANFISEPVLVGFKAGIGLVIVFDQIPKILGIHFARGTFFHNLLSLFHGVPSTSPTTLLLGIVMIALLLGFERLAPRAPAPLIAVAIGIIGVSLLRLQDHGVELVGQIPQGLPSIVKPDLPLVKVLWPGALGIALMSFTETVAAGRAFTATGEPSPERQSRVIGDRPGKCCGRLHRMHARRRWDVADGRQSPCGSAYSVVRNCHGRYRPIHDALPGPASRVDASSNSCRRRYRIFDWADPTIGLPSDSQVLEKQNSPGPWLPLPA